VAIEFTVDHDHTYAAEGGIQQLIGWITFSLGTYPGDFRVRDLGAGMPRTMNIPPRRGWLAPDGHLYQDQTLAQPCRLVANDPAFNLRHLTYRADFALTTLAGDPVAVPHTFFSAPSADSTLPLTKVMSDPYQPVMEIRAKVYTEDIIDAGDFGQNVVFTGTPTEFWELAGTVPSTSLPAYVDDVLEFTNQAAFPVSEEARTGVIYVDVSTNDSFRWSGSTYVRISDRVTASGITDSTKLGRALVTIPSEAGARSAMRIPEPQSPVVPAIGLYTWYELTMLPASAQWLGLRHIRFADPSPTDAELKFFAVNGLDIMYTGQAQGGYYGADTSGVAAVIADYTDLIDATLGAYGPRGTYWAANPTVPYNPILAWEVFNEPNFWWPYTGIGTNATGASVSGMTATITFPSAPNPAFSVGDWVHVEGITPTGYNTPNAWTRYQITAVANTSGNYSISYTLPSTTGTGTQTVAGRVIGAKSTAYHYAQVLAATYDHIKATWPEVTVVACSAGAASAAGSGWVRSVLENLEALDRLDAFDAISTHPYTWKSFDQTMHDFFGDWSGVTEISHTRTAMNDHGVDRPIWITEAGHQVLHAEGGTFSDPSNTYEGGPAAFSQSVVAAYTIRTAIMSAVLGIERVYYMHTCDTDNYNAGWFSTDAGSLSWLRSQGVTSTTVQPRKTATAMRLLNRLVGDATKLEILSDGLAAPTTTPFVYRFTTPRGRVTVAWCETSGSYSIPVDPDITWRATDHLGTAVDTFGGSSTYLAALSPTPIFIVAEPSRKRITSTVTSMVKALTAVPDADFTTYLGVGASAVMPSAVGNSSTYTFVNTDSESHDVYTAIKTVALLHGEGANNSTTITDSGLVVSNWTAVNGAKISTAQHQFGSASIDINSANTANRSDGSGPRIVATADSSTFAWGTGDFTIEFWLRLTALPSSGQAIILDTRPGGANGNHLVLYMEASLGNKIIFYNSGSPHLGTAAAPSTDVWHHVAVSRASGVTRMFLDGTQSGTPYSGTPTDYTDSMDYEPCQPVFGSDSTGKNQIAGYIDEVRFTKGEGLYTADFTPPSSALSPPETATSVASGARTDFISNGTTWVVPGS